MKQTLVVGAAPLPGRDAFYRELLSAADHVVAADAAGEWCVALGRVPDAVVGDFDGSRAGAACRLEAQGATVEVHPMEKDSTDLDLAIAYARRTWRVPVAITAAFTSRFDHTLAALGALVRAGDEASVREPGWSAWLSRESRGVRLELAAGVVVSVVALVPEVRVTIDGAAWPLHDAVLPLLSGLGVSNRSVGGHLTVTATNGIVAIIVQDGE
jgi:thiamine pyrophosphokinase